MHKWTISTALSGGCFFAAAAIQAAPEFNPQFRWQQERITVADNHEAAPPPAENRAAPSDIKEDSVSEELEMIESSIMIDDIIEPPASYRYSSFNKRDPFAYPDREEFLDDDFAVSKLQRHDISSLKLVGVWRLSTGISKALVLTPAGEGIVAAIGDPVGRNNGEIMEIGRNKIIIREYLMTPDGTRQFNDVDMFLEDYFGDEADYVMESGVSAPPPQNKEESLEEALNKLIKDKVEAGIEDHKKVHQGINAPHIHMAPPAGAVVPSPGAVNAPASTNAPPQP